MKGEKQLFGRTGNIAPQKHQEAQLRVTDSGRIIFPSQEKIFGQLDHILGVFKNSEAEIRPHSHLTGPSGLCCNPLHLEMVSHITNQKRRAQRAKENISD